MKTAHGRITMFAVLLSLFLAGAAQATPTVDLGTASGSPGAQVIISVTLTNDGIAPVAGVATDIGYNSEFLTPVSVAVGPAGTAAGKSAASNIVSPGLYRVGIFSSANVNNIGNGVGCQCHLCDKRQRSCYQLPAEQRPQRVDRHRGCYYCHGQ